MCGVKPTAGRVWKLWNCYNKYEGRKWFWTEKKEDKNGDKKKDEKKENKPKPNQISPEQLKNLLKAMNNEEKKVQEKVNKNKIKGKPVKNKKDW